MQEEYLNTHTHKNACKKHKKENKHKIKNQKAHEIKNNKDYKIHKLLFTVL